MKAKYIKVIVTVIAILSFISLITIQMLVIEKEAGKAAIIRSCTNIIQSNLKSPSSFKLVSAHGGITPMSMEKRIEKANKVKASEYGDLLKDAYLNGADDDFKEGFILIMYKAKNLYGVELSDSALCKYESSYNSFDLKEYLSDNQIYEGIDLLLMEGMDNRYVNFGQGHIFLYKILFAKYLIFGQVNLNR